MKTLRVTPDPEQIELSITLRHFITDWPSAQGKFVAGITRRLRDLTVIQPHDLKVSYANSLGDASCTCRLFGGAASIVLNADSLKLSFANVTPRAYEVVFAAIQRSWEFLASDFPEHGIAWFSLHSSQDVAASDDAAVDTYLEQFAHDGAVAVAEQEAGIRYRPSIRVTFKEHDRHWQLHRSVEESTTLAKGLFVTTSIYMPESELEAFGGLQEAVARLHAIADSAVGLLRGD
ncbi:MAG: hypothetical protein OXH75_26650 [Acidobacteria bacterium]|nr:hypothetical protein [Acidobacteriota bacterium]